MLGIEVCHLVDPVVRSPGNKLYQCSLCSFVTGREFRLPHFVFLDLMKIRRCCDAVWRERNDDRLFHPRMALGLHEEYEWAVTLDENLLSECCACGGSIDDRTELSDPHFQARGFPVEVEHPELGESFTYAGAPYQLPKALWAIHRRAPLLGKHNAEIYGGELGVGRGGGGGAGGDGGGVAPRYGLALCPAPTHPCMTANDRTTAASVGLRG